MLVHRDGRSRPGQRPRFPSDPPRPRRIGLVPLRPGVRVSRSRSRRPGRVWLHCPESPSSIWTWTSHDRRPGLRRTASTRRSPPRTVPTAQFIATAAPQRWAGEPVHVLDLTPDRSSSQLPPLLSSGGAEVTASVSNDSGRSCCWRLRTTVQGRSHLTGSGGYWSAADSTSHSPYGAYHISCLRTLCALDEHDGQQRATP